MRIGAYCREGPSNRCIRRQRRDLGRRQVGVQPPPPPLQRRVPGPAVVARLAHHVGQLVGGEGGEEGLEGLGERGLAAEFLGFEQGGVAAAARGG